MKKVLFFDESESERFLDLKRSMVEFDVVLGKTHANDYIVLKSKSNGVGTTILQEELGEVIEGF